MLNEGMKRMLLIALVVALVIACAFGGYFVMTGQAFFGEDEILDELHFYQWEDYTPQEVLDSFEEEYGIHVNMILFDDEITSKDNILSYPGKYDLYVAGDVITEELISLGKLEEVNKRNIENFKNIDSRFLDKTYDPSNKYSIPYAYGTTGIIYNTKYFDNPPEFDDFWNLKHKGYAGMVPDLDLALSSLFAYTGVSTSSNYITDYVKIRSFLELVREVTTFFGIVSLREKLINEELWISTGYDADYFVTFEENKNLAYSLPEGSLLWIDNMIIPKGAKNKRGAELFIDYTLRPEVSAKISESSYTLTPIVGAIDLVEDEDLHEYYDMIKESDIVLFSDSEKSERFNDFKKEIEQIMLEELKE